MDLFDPSNLVKTRKILGKAKEQLAVLQRVYDELLGMETAFETGRFSNMHCSCISCHLVLLTVSSKFGIYHWT